MFIWKCHDCLFSVRQAAGHKCHHVFWKKSILLGCSNKSPIRKLDEAKNKIPIPICLWGEEKNSCRKMPESVNYSSFKRFFLHVFNILQITDKKWVLLKGTVSQSIFSLKSDHHGAIDLWNNSDFPKYIFLRNWKI